MTTSCRCVLFSMILFAAACTAQTGTVTFYTPGNTVKSETASLLPRSQQPFTGWIFDGQQRLAHVQRGRFMTFQLAPGAHTFTAPWHPKKPGIDKAVIELVAGEQHCLRLYAKMTNFEVLPYARLNSQIEEIPCGQVPEAGRLKPIDPRRVDPAVRGELDSATVFPGFEGESH